MTDWEKRARELLNDKRTEHNETRLYTGFSAAQVALQIGREMADEARTQYHAEWEPRARRAEREAADARAEEIAKKIESRPRSFDVLSRAERFVCADIARSFISKPKPPKTREHVLEEALREMVEKFAALKDPIENNFVIAHCLELARRVLERQS